ncbi:hypothetical protein V7S43_001589 [Phytophthora oleae]|uniref:Uncharacterized protein n=1 Tax=Phytophthora oleae TaxID=2107226 RepID=A0ABD3G5M6_9STRA
MSAFVVAKLVRLWRAAQVELQGEYSTQRVQALFNYYNYASNLRVLLVLLGMPLPCFLLIMIVDSQFKHTVPPAPLSNVKIVVYGAIVAVITVTVMYSLTLAIGYPLPFGIVTVSPAWTCFLLAPFVSWMRNAWHDPTVWPMLMNVLKIMVCQQSLVFIYPTYFYLFTTIPESGKTAFSLLLPIMKVVLRGIMAKTVDHLKDEIPLVVVVNVDLFSALFSTYCMQSSPSVKTTCVLMAVDILQICMSLYDIEIVVQRMRALKKQSGVLQSVKVQGKLQGSTSEPDVLRSTKWGQSDARSSASNLFVIVQESKRRMSTNRISPKPKSQTKNGLSRKIAPMLAEFGDGTVTKKQRLREQDSQTTVRAGCAKGAVHRRVCRSGQLRGSCHPAYIL